jgi:hypothetical protein
MRKLLGAESDTLSDAEMQRVIESIYYFSDAIIDYCLRAQQEKSNAQDSQESGAPL